MSDLDPDTTVDAAPAQQADSLDWSSLVVKGLIGYFTVSMLTMPFVNDVWLGDWPVLVIIQFPKMLPALWLRQHVVMNLIRLMGLSSGSVSPDCIVAGPYGLALAYLLLVATLCVVVWRTRAQRPSRKLLWLLAVVGLLDFVATLYIAQHPTGVSIY